MTGRVRRLAACTAALTGALAAAAGAGCTKGAAGAPARPPTQPALTIQPLPAAAEQSERTHAPAAPARAHQIGSIGRKALGPFMAEAGDGGLAAWVVAAERGGGAQLVVVPLGADGAPMGDPKAVADAPRDATALVVRPVDRARGGWLVAWSALLDRGESLTLLELAPDGTARGAPVDVQRTGDHIAWLDLLPTASGAVCVWAEETTGGTANVLTAPIDASGKPAGVPARVVLGVDGWAAARGDQGAALAIVTRDKPGSRDALALLRLDALGRPVGGPVAIGKESAVGGEVELVAVPGGWLLAWTDRSGEDAQVALAAVDAAGGVRGPVRAMNAVGGSALVRLASGPSGVALAWREPHGRARPVRALHLADVNVGQELAASPRTSVEVAQGSAVELAPLDDGFALLASAPVCSVEPGGAGPCGGGVAPTFVRFDARWTAIQAEPLLVGANHAPAAIGWSLQCASARCVALGASGETPTPVFAFDLSPRSSPFATPVAAPPPADAPRVVGSVTLASGAPFTDVAAARAGDATLVATLAGAKGKAADRADARAAQVTVRPFDDAGQPLAAPIVLSSRALPVGGVAIAAAPDPRGGGAVAWVARDGGDPQVHVARLDPRGRPVKDAQVTTAKGDASDVAIAWAGDGWLLAWVDARDGNGEVYAAKVGRDLEHIGAGQRITRAPGDAADVALAVRGDVAWVAWSDPRESPAEGLSDVHVAALRARDGSRAGDDVRVLATAAHSRSPSLAVVGDGTGALVAWIEDAPTGVDAAGSAMIARVDTAGHVLGAPAALELAGEGRPTAVVLSAAPIGGAVRAVVARATRDELTLDALSLGDDGKTASPPWPLVDLDAPASFDVALTLAGDALVYDDAGATPDDRRVRRALVSWGARARGASGASSR